jgi:hypothetical protein
VEQHDDGAAPTMTPPVASVSPSASASSSSYASAGAAAVDEGALVLPIPAREQAAEAPPSGWCGETAIQEGLLYLGVWTPQRLINIAGHPLHPDLYSPEIPVALSELGVRYTFYSRARGYDSFAQWVRSALEEGDPVLAGVKILPTEHPEWGLDHFVLIVGHGKRGLLVNTTWGTREWVGDTHTKGLSLANAFYGIRLGGLEAKPNVSPARITLLGESEAGMRLHVTCTHVKPGVAYRLERRERRSDILPTWSEELRPGDAGAGISKDVNVPADRPARFHCVPL